MACCGLKIGVCGPESSRRCRMIGCPCVTVPHALSALRSLQGNRCQQSCTPGFYHESGEGVCKPCDGACATCAGERPPALNAPSSSSARSVRFNLHLPLQVQALRRATAVQKAT